MGQEEVVVEKLVYSDLQFSGSSLDIAVFSPWVYDQYTKMELSKDGRVQFPLIVGSVSRFIDMYHRGILTCSGEHDSYQTQGQPIRFVWCGGKALLSRSRWIICDRCTMAFQSQYDNERFQNAMFHLMLKQMVPDLPCCNFVDGSITPASDGLTSKELNAIRLLGVIAVDCCLRDSSIHRKRPYRLGFTFMPGIRTRTHGPEEFGSWLQYLVFRKFQQLEELHEIELPMLFGPKPVRD